eukprot:scaffold4860_cov171-Amphora_coffeaeformis.AAC.3
MVIMLQVMQIPLEAWLILPKKRTVGNDSTEESAKMVSQAISSLIRETGLQTQLQQQDTMFRREEAINQRQEMSDSLLRS